MRYLLTALLLVPALVSAQELHTFKNGEVADADKINENFSRLSNVIRGEGDSSRFLEQTTLPDGNIFTKLYMYESGHYSGWVVRPPEGDFRTWGVESLTNALGTFEGAYMYVWPNSGLPPPTNTNLPVTCPDGSDLEFQYQTNYGLSYRNQTGAILLDTSIGDMSGIYRCPSYEQIEEYYILEGKGLGGYECIQNVVYYGSLGGGNGTGFQKNWQGSVRTGYFDPESNGLFGTYYLEIIAPPGCIPTM